jgi:choice-of-anchor B domain-containing protein
MRLPASTAIAWALLGCVPAVAAPVRHLSRISRDVVFHSRLHEYDRYSDVWGYTAPDGREYALFGVMSGIVVANVTNRAHPYEVAFLPRAPTAWRDIKTFGPFAYDVGEGGGGLGITDLSDPENPVALPARTDFAQAHNMFVDVGAGLALVAGANVVPGGRIYSLSTPQSPVFIGQWNWQYAHDVFSRDGLMFVSAIQARALFLVDITDPAAPVDVSSVFYPNAYTHNAWLSDDGRHLMTTDEHGGAFCRVWDVVDPAFPALVGLWRLNTKSIPHNAHLDGDLAYVSYYTAGVRILDMSDPELPVETGYYDTHLQSDLGYFSGCWGVFPHFPLSPGLFLATDIHLGLHVLEHVPGGSGRGDRRDPAPAAGPGLGLPRPNPLVAGATVVLPLAVGGSVRVSVHDAAGRLVRRLTPGRTGSLEWDGRDGSGRAVAAGVYFVEAAGAEGREVRRVTVVR